MNIARVRAGEETERKRGREFLRAVETTRGRFSVENKHPVAGKPSATTPSKEPS